MTTGGEVKLAMALCVRDEADVLEDNIGFHRACGVDQFIVTDNGSVDDTPEILRRLQRAGDVVVLYEPDHTMQQERWMTRMARMARDELGADWLLASDADELWWPREGDLKTEMAALPTATVLHCRRNNLLPSRRLAQRAGHRFWMNTVRVVRPLSNRRYQWAERFPSFVEPPHPVLMGPIGLKVACRLPGLREICHGNHDAHYVAGRVERQLSRNIIIYHYPLRDYDSFERKVRNMGAALGRRAGPDSVGWSQKRLFRLWEQGKLRAEYDRHLLTDDAIAAYEARKIVRLDDRVRAWFTDRAPSR